MANQQKGVQQDTAYSAIIVVNVSPSLPISFFNVSMTLLSQKRYRDGDTYDHSLQLLHYRQYLVALLFADLPSLSPFIS